MTEQGRSLGGQSRPGSGTRSGTKFCPFGDGQDGENKDDYEPTGENDNKSSRREASVKEQYGGDASQAFRMHGG
ncbi:hypothetical protein VCV18_004779 [Metarhizium anisopliae]